jgi:hypothetical protein
MCPRTDELQVSGNLFGRKLTGNENRLSTHKEAIRLNRFMKLESEREPMMTTIAAINIAKSRYSRSKYERGSGLADLIDIGSLGLDIVVKLTF